MKKVLFLGALISGAVAVSSAHAESANQNSCATLIKECFAHGDSTGHGDAKTKCFYEKGSDPVCSGTALGSLIMQRWGMSASASFASDGADLLTGPAMVDQDCLDKFDSRLSSKLVQGDVSDESYSNLRDSLDKCAAVASPDELSRQ